jgi:hypothetical protein
MMTFISFLVIYMCLVQAIHAYNQSIASQYSCGDPRWALATNDSQWSFNITIWTLSHVFLRPGFIGEELCPDCKSHNVEPWFFINASVAIPASETNHTKYLNEMYDSAMQCTKYATVNLHTEPVFFNFPCANAPHWRW